jgi:hypothetical protein
MSETNKDVAVALPLPKTSAVASSNCFGTFLRT